ncbi:MAG: hypothetical protein COV48_13770, partial [Elusimicrobia bacterium CG11_big_fil_rev_8_21_14_0_20_64_6]
KRVERRKNIGSLRHLRVVGRTSSGRAQAVEVVGAGGTLMYTGSKGISDLLSPNSLRSTLFTVQLVMKGKKISRVILWGAGTGSGLGFPRAGALGQASLGIDWREIVRHYFPRLEIKDFLHPTVEKKRPKGVGPYKRTLDFHKQKKNK